MDPNPREPVMVECWNLITNYGTRSSLFDWFYAAPLDQKKKYPENEEASINLDWYKKNQIKLSFPAADSIALTMAPLNTLNDVFYMMFALSLFGIFLWMPTIFLVIFYLCMPDIGLAIALMVIVLVSIGIYYKYGISEKWPVNGSIINDKWMNIAMLYYSYRMIIEEDPEIYKKLSPLIYAFGPHGVFAVAPGLQTLINYTFFGVDIHFLGANVIFWIPIFNIMLKRCGYRSIDRKNFIDILTKQKKSVGIIPGGIAEMFAPYDENEETLFIQNRKGFIAIALQTGTPIVPCFSFGNSQTFSSSNLQIFQKVSRILKMSLIIFWGRFGLPIPFRVPILTVVGKPIQMPKLVPSDTPFTPSEELINQYHQIYLMEVNRIFDTYKGLYGWNHKKLVFKK